MNYLLHITLIAVYATAYPLTNTPTPNQALISGLMRNSRTPVSKFQVHKASIGENGKHTKLFSDYLQSRVHEKKQGQVAGHELPIHEERLLENLGRYDKLSADDQKSLHDSLQWHIKDAQKEHGYNVLKQDTEGSKTFKNDKLEQMSQERNAAYKKLRDAKTDEEKVLAFKDLMATKKTETEAALADKSKTTNEDQKLKLQEKIEQYRILEEIATKRKSTGKTWSDMVWSTEHKKFTNELNRSVEKAKLVKDTTNGPAKKPEVRDDASSVVDMHDFYAGSDNGDHVAAPLAGVTQTVLPAARPNHQGQAVFTQQIVPPHQASANMNGEHAQMPQSTHVQTTQRPQFEQHQMNQQNGAPLQNHDQGVGPNYPHFVDQPNGGVHHTADAPAPQGFGPSYPHSEISDSQAPSVANQGTQTPDAGTPGQDHSSDGQVTNDGSNKKSMWKRYGKTAAYSTGAFALGVVGTQQIMDSKNKDEPMVYPEIPPLPELVIE
ncbi:hypothetical protein ROZALSC1DRAFT_29911 [Rozella allomycis CSF55]|uniref:Uncharacterized protein n=1 Tax=Rozella allomycis (strain CSF55) TaxID=988480 RepID=A0A4P9YFY6_ROZAC|nr:hypothetical protein ROZALSC1DRAFT_29911 [Rozella allomycis CSF55]